MRNPLIIAAAIVSLGIGSAFAQTAPAPVAPPAATPIATPAPAATPSLTKDGKPKAKEVRAACKTEAENKSIGKGEARKSFMRECIGKQRPDLVKAFDCRKEAKAKNLEKAEMKAFMKECKAKG